MYFKQVETSREVCLWCIKIWMCMNASVKKGAVGKGTLWRQRQMGGKKFHPCRNRSDTSCESPLQLFQNWKRRETEWRTERIEEDLGADTKILGWALKEYCTRLSCRAIRNKLYVTGWLLKYNNKVIQNPRYVAHLHVFKMSSWRPTPTSTSTKYSVDHKTARYSGEANWNPLDLSMYMYMYLCSWWFISSTPELSNHRSETYVPFRYHKDTLATRTHNQQHCSHDWFIGFFISLPLTTPQTREFGQPQLVHACTC